MDYSLNTVIMSILMSLSPHFNISVSSELICLLIVGHVFLPLPISVIFHWMTDTLIFTLLGAGSFHIPINVLQLCPWMQLSCLKTVWSSCVLSLWFARWIWHRAQARANYAPLLRQEALDTQSNVPWIMKLSSPAGGKIHYSWPSVSICAVYFNPFVWSFSGHG